MTYQESPRTVRRVTVMNLDFTTGKVRDHVATLLRCIGCESYNQPTKEAVRETYRRVNLEGARESVIALLNQRDAWEMDEQARLRLYWEK